MSTLLAGGSSTAALSSLLNLKLGCLLLPFYFSSKYRQKNYVRSYRINTCSTLSLGKKKNKTKKLLFASEKQHRKLNSKQEDLSQFSRTWTEQVWGEVKAYFPINPPALGSEGAGAEPAVRAAP